MKGAKVFFKLEYKRKRKERQAIVYKFQRLNITWLKQTVREQVLFFTLLPRQVARDFFSIKTRGMVQPLLQCLLKWALQTFTGILQDPWHFFLSSLQPSLNRIADGS